MSVLVLLTQAQAHLRLPVTTDDDTTDPDLVAKLDQAELIILDYLNLTPEMRTVTAAWTIDDVPFPVTASILLELGELWRFRGDDVQGETPARDPANTDLSPVIMGLLRRIQPPVIA